MFDIWDMFIRRRWTFALVLGLCLAASVAYVAIDEPDYQVTGRVEIGGRSVDGRFRALEDPSTVANRLTGEFVPTAAQEHLDDIEENTVRRSLLLGKISASAAPGTQVVRVRATVSEEKLPMYERILSSSLDRLVDAHTQYAEILRISTEERLEELRNQIASLREDRGKKSAQIGRVETLKSRIEQEIEDLKKTIDSIQSTRMNIMEGTASVDASVATMLAADDLREARNLLNQKRERAYFQLPNRMDDLNFELSQIERQIEVKKLQLQEIETEAGLVRNTRVVEQPGDYLETEATSPVVVVAAGGILGGIAAVLAVFVAEFNAAARARRTQSGTTT